MSTTIHFYNCFLRHNGNITNNSVSDFLDGVISLDEGQRFVDNELGEYSLIEMIMPTQNPNNNQLDRIVGFANYRDKKPFLGTRGTDQKQEINGDILELTTALFIPYYHLAIIEYNHFGARPKHIERYLNQFLPKEDGNHWDFEFMQIETQNSFNDIRQSNDIRNIELKLDLLSNQTNIFEEDVAQESITYRLLNSPIQAYRDFGANVATISLGQGRHKSNPMDFDTLLSLLQVIDLESDVFASVKVRYHSPTARRLVTADLKNEGVLKKVILENEEHTAFESIGFAISEYYYTQSNRLANQEWRNHATELMGIDLPLIRRRFVETPAVEVIN